MRRSKRKRVPTRRVAEEDDVELAFTSTSPQDTNLIPSGNSPPANQSLDEETDTAIAPTALEALKKKSKTIEGLKKRLEATRQTIKSLENERDFLRNALSQALAIGTKNKGTDATSSVAKDDFSDTESESSSSTSPSYTSSSSSSSSSFKKRKTRKRKRARKQGKKGNKAKKTPKKANRVLTPEEAISRYQKVLRAVKERKVTKVAAYQRVGVNRKTIADTSAIAELKTIDEEAYEKLRATMDKRETLASFTKRCKSKIESLGLQDKVDSLKEEGKLLKIYPRKCV